MAIAKKNAPVLNNQDGLFKCVGVKPLKKL